MTEVWNLWEVKPPPICTVKTQLYLKEMNDLSEITYDALKTLRDLSHFDREAAILSRFLYKYRRIFRHDKGIQNLVKVNQCLKRYLKLNMVEILFTFKQSIPFNFNLVSTHVYLPTRQMLKWVLLRLQAFSQIFVRVVELTKSAGNYIYKKLCLGWSLYNSLFAFCITARILVTSKYLVAKSIEWYSSLYKYLPYLKETSNYLPDYNFPVNLKLWLGEVDLSPIKKKTFIDKVFEFIDLAEDDEEGDEDDKRKILRKDFSRALFNIKNANMNSDAEETEVEEIEEEIKEVKQPLQTYLPYEDLGVPVEGNKEKEIALKKKKRRRRKTRRTFIDLVPVEDNKGEDSKVIKKSKKICTDLVSIGNDREEASNAIKRRKRTFTNIDPTGGDKKESPKKIKNRKRTFIDLDPFGGNKEETPKKTKKKNKK